MIKKVTLQFIFLSIFSVLVYSQNGKVNIDPIYFNIDKSNRIIVVNCSIDQLNLLYSESKNSILSNNINYSFNKPVSEFEIGKTYKVVDINDNYYELYFTQLPIINIISNNKILDEPRVFANFSMCESDGNLTGNAIGIEYRGGWTQSLSKKSLRIEFWNDTLGNETKDVSLLKMRSDDDWNIQAMYNEPLRLRSKVCNELWREIDTIYYFKNEPEAINGVRQEYIELFFNNEYLGLYALSERIDRKQLKLKKYKDEEMRGELYKGVSWGASTFKYLPGYNNSNNLWGGFEFEYPKDETNWANLYEFVDLVIKGDSLRFYENYQKRFNIDNAINYFIFLNLIRAADNTGKNIFIAKYKEDEPYFYIPFDLDGSFGTNWNGTKENITNDILTNGFYNRLLFNNIENGCFEKLKNRWNKLRSNIITIENITELFNTQFNYLKLNGIYERDFKVWQDCEIFDYNSIEYTIEWLQNRLNYLDIVFNNQEMLTNIHEHKLIEKTGFKIYPNPASNFIYFKGTKENYTVEKISIFNFLGQTSILNSVSENKGRINISNLKNGVYLIVVDFRNGNRQVEKLFINK